MSHFTGIVVGSNIKGQIAKYNEHTQVKPYKTGDVSEEEQNQFLDYYREKQGLSPETSFEDAYPIHGKNWNGNCWKQNAQGAWEEYSTYNPDSKWDWWVIGGRWSNFFLLKDGTRADRCFKRDIDIEGMKKDSYDKAFAYFNLVASCFPDNTIPVIDLKWNDEEAWKEYNCPDVDAKRTIYHTRPAMLALQNARTSSKLTKEQKDCIIWVDLEDFNGYTAETYAESRSKEALIPYCVIIKGEWVQKGRMGWFGMSTDESDNWPDTFLKIWDSIHDNTIVSLVDFHI